MRVTVSRHYLRRRARTVAHRLDHADPTHNYTVERAERGPFRWRVVRTNRPKYAPGPVKVERY